MHISIAGNLGSGKSTICNILKAKYGYRVYSTGEIHREIAKRQNVSTLEMNKLMTKESGHDFSIDDAVTKISMEKSDEVIVFDSRMAWKFAHNSFKIFVVVDPLVAAARVMAAGRGAEEVYQSVEDAKQKLIERSRVENERFKLLYHVDNFDYGNYNLIIDSTHASPDMLAAIIYDAYQKYRESGHSRQILLAPTSLYPTKAVNPDPAKVAAYQAGKAYERDPIAMAVVDGYHYIVDGHHRMLAAALNREDFVSVQVVDWAGASGLHSIGMTAVYDFETAGNFVYDSYPRAYKK